MNDLEQLEICTSIYDNTDTDFLNLWVAFRFGGDTLGVMVYTIGKDETTLEKSGVTLELGFDGKYRLNSDMLKGCMWRHGSQPYLTRANKFYCRELWDGLQKFGFEVIASGKEEVNQKLASLNK